MSAAPVPGGHLDVAVESAAMHLRPFMHVTMRTDLRTRAPAGKQVIPAAAFTEPATIRRFSAVALADICPHPESEDPRIGAGRLIKRYAFACMTAGLLPLAHGVAPDVSLSNLGIVVENEQLVGAVLQLDGGELRCAERPTVWPSRGPVAATIGEFRAHVLDALFERNLAAVVDAALSAYKVSPRLYWSGVAEQADLFYTSMETAWPDRKELLASDRRVVLDAERVHGMLTSEFDPGYGREFPVRAVCCMQFRLSTRSGKYCGTCGLTSFEDRCEKRARILTNVAVKSVV